MTSSLRSFLQTAGFVSIGAIKKWCKQILAGLEYLHRQCNPPIIHRDIKLDNIFFNGATGQVKIGDLGLATIVSPKMSIIGTPEFMAPEFYNDTYNEKVDIWEFGLCVIEMATQEYPYSECTNVGSVYRTVSLGLKPQALAKIKNHKIIEFVCCCLEEDVSNRLSSTDLLIHPFLNDDPELDALYTSLRNEDEITKALQVIGSPPTKKGWETWIANTVTPIREHRKRRLAHSQPFSVSGEGHQTPFNSDLKKLVKFRSESNKMSGMMRKRSISEEDDVLLETEPFTPLPLTYKPESRKTSLGNTQPESTNSRKTSLTASTPETSTRIESQISKNLQEFSSPATLTFSQSPNNN